VLTHLARPAALSSLLALTPGCVIESEAAQQGPSQDEFSCDAIVGEGHGLGQVSMNWTLDDADGQPHSLYDFCGRPIYIEDTAAW
jgi:hypothetical protein